MEEKTNKLLIPSAIIVAAILIAGALIYTPRGEEKTNDVSTADVSSVLADDDVVLGSPDAPVTVVSFGDFQCPFCKQLFNDGEAQIRKEYVETGKVKFIYRDFPLDVIHPFARPAAEAAECSRDQGSYWKYHDELFARQANIPTLDFVALAGELGLDTEEFSKCVTERKYQDEVEKDYQDGLAVGVTGTPATFVGNTLISGARPYSIFKQAIESELAKINK